MKSTRWFGSVLLFAFALVHPLAAQPASPAPAAPTRHTLWRVQSKRQRGYLLGSIHLLKPEDYPLAPAIEAAFTNSAIAAFETDISKLTEIDTQTKLMAKGALPEGDTLEAHLSPGTYAALTNPLVHSGMPPQMFDSFNPCMAA